MDMLTTTSSDQEPIENGASGSSNNNIINNNYFNSVIKEHMFDKLLTPSDVGKLNRIVIPKQHAENYFPLEDNQTGMSLDFQDRNGKMWRIKYSYWNSSQSYVMTKGWSRFVKDKKLDTGDTVSFHRAYVPDNSEPENPKKILFIDWRHKAEITHHHYPIFGSPAFPTAGYYPVPEYSMPHYRSFQEREFLGYGYGNGGRYYAGSPLDHHHQWNLGRSEQSVYDSYPVFPTPRVISSSSAMLLPSPPSQPLQEGTTAKKLIRLFGVDVGESSSSGETRGEMGVAGYSLSSPVVIRDDESPHGEMGAPSSSSAMLLSDDEEYKRKEKSLEY